MEIKSFQHILNTTKKDLIKQAKEYTATLEGQQKQNGEWYVKLMSRALAGGDSFVEKESARLSRMIEGGQVSAQFLDSFQIRKNILSQF